MIDIREKLLSLEDVKYKEFNKKLCPDTKREILGIRIPELKKLAKEIVKTENGIDIFKKMEDKYFEEIILHGFLVAYSKIEWNEKIKYIKEIVPKMDSWAITDTFVPALKIKKKDLRQAWNLVLNYISSEKEFEVRFAIIMILDYFITEEYIDRVIKLLDNVKHDGYYVKMGVAWCIAEIGVKFNDRATEYLKNNNLDKFTHNKAIQKMIESRRISENQKQDLRKMKK